MVRTILYYGSFVGLSILLHWWWIGPPPARRPSKPLRVAARFAPPTPPASAPATPPPSATKPRPGPEPKTKSPREYADNAPVRERAELESLRQEMQRAMQALREQTARELAEAQRAREQAEKQLASLQQRSEQQLAEAQQRHRREIEALREESRRSLAEERERWKRQLEAERARIAEAERRQQELERTLAARAEEAKRLRSEQKRLAEQLAAARRAAASPPAPRPSPPADSAAAARASDAALARRLAQLDDWQRYARAAQRETFDAEKVPVLRFAGDKTESEFLDLMRFYGMEVVVFPPSLRYLAHVDLPSGQIRPIDDPRGFIGRFSRRSIEQHGSYWRSIAARVAQRLGGRAEDLIVQTVIPHRTAGYLAWKELEVLRANGLQPSEVAVCYGSYRRTPNGTWVVDITHVRTFDDRLIPVRGRG